LVEGAHFGYGHGLLLGLHRGLLLLLLASAADRVASRIVRHDVSGVQGGAVSCIEEGRGWLADWPTGCAVDE